MVNFNKFCRAYNTHTIQLRPVSTIITSNWCMPQNANYPPYPHVYQTHLFLSLEQPRRQLLLWDEPRFVTKIGVHGISAAPLHVHTLYTATQVRLGSQYSHVALSHHATLLHCEDRTHFYLRSMVRQGNATYFEPGRYNFAAPILNLCRYQQNHLTQVIEKLTVNNWISSSFRAIMSLSCSSSGTSASSYNASNQSSGSPENPRELWPPPRWPPPPGGPQEKPSSRWWWTSDQTSLPGSPAATTPPTSHLNDHERHRY